MFGFVAAFGFFGRGGNRRGGWPGDGFGLGRGLGWSGRAVVVFRLRVGLGDKPLPLLLQGAADGFLFFFSGGAARCDLLEIKAHAGVVHFAADADGQGLAFGVAFEADVFGDFVAGKVELAAAGHGGGGPGKRGLGAVAADAVLDVGFQHKMAERHGGGFGFGRAVADAGEQVADAVEADARPFAVVNIQFHAAVEAGEHFVGAAALRGEGEFGGAFAADAALLEQILQHGVDLHAFGFLVELVGDGGAVLDDEAAVGAPAV